MSQENSYKDIMSQLPPKQKIVLQAIAKEGLAQNITSSKFIKKYNMTSASSVQAAVKLLLKNDLITQTDTGYRVYDFFLSEWLATTY
jgi:RIO-like serine/threonine protein kinase